jgi:hypothetical protein
LHTWKAILLHEDWWLLVQEFLAKAHLVQLHGSRKINKSKDGFVSCGETWVATLILSASSSILFIYLKTFILYGSCIHLGGKILENMRGAY